MKSGHLWEISGIFLKLGLFGFGGPVAVMAMMEEECCGRREWITQAQFNEIYAVCKILPGPVATQMGIYLGRERGGALGGLASGFFFILPSFLIVLAASYFYAHSGWVKSLGPALQGLQAGALAVILLSTWGLSRPYRRKPLAWLIVIFSTGVVFLHPSWEPLIIVAFGLYGALQSRRISVSRMGLLVWLAILGVSGTLFWGRRALAAVETSLAIGSWDGSAGVLGHLFWTCFKAGAFVFGTGLAVVPVLEGDAVRHFHWLTHSQFMDGLALGQVTPGPVVITATFIGYMAAGLMGALAATAGMFLPPFFNVLVLVPRVWRKVGGTPAAAGFSAFAIPAVVGGILGTTIKLGSITLVTPATDLVFAFSLGAAIFLRPPAWLLIPAAGLGAWILIAVGLR